MMTFIIFAVSPFVVIYIIYKIIKFVIGLIRVIVSDEEEYIGQEPKAPLTRIFTVQCPRCGISTLITGNAKVVTCEYCNRDFQVDWSYDDDGDGDEDEDRDTVISLASYYGASK